MRSSFPNVHEHMRGLALGALRHANWHANYFSPDNFYWSELSVLQAGHACEILIKARIAQEHPLLIFESLPKASPDEEPLTLQQLVQKGRTYQFKDLPDRLWATTGLRLPAIELYRDFADLRNCIQHFVVPEHVNVERKTLEFIYSVIDPFLHECWGLYAIDYNEDTEPYQYLIEGLVSRGISFLVSPESVDAFKWAELDWPKNNPDYRAYIETQVAEIELARELRK